MNQFSQNLVQTLHSWRPLKPKNFKFPMTTHKLWWTYELVR